MEFFKTQTDINFLRGRAVALTLSSLLMVASVATLATRGLNFGIDFRGGTLVEVGYQDAVEINSVRTALATGALDDAVVQHFGTPRDVLVRLPAAAVGGAAEIGDQVMAALRIPYQEIPAEGSAPGGLQQCWGDGSGDSADTAADTEDAAAALTDTTDCQVQLRRLEFVGPQVGDELANQGGLAMLYALIGILIYVTFRFEWRFAIGSVVALVHDVLITLGAFSALQLDFSLSVLAAILAVIGYSLNDTIVVYDRIRENFRKERKRTTLEIINGAINRTLPRTVLTSVTTLMVVLTLLLFGGEVIRGFSIALLIGVLIGTYSSIFVASPAVAILGITREDMLLQKKEGAVDPAP